MFLNAPSWWRENINLTDCEKTERRVKQTKNKLRRRSTFKKACGGEHWTPYLYGIIFKPSSRGKTKGIQKDTFHLVLLFCYLTPYLFWQGTSLIWNKSPQYISFGQGWARHLLNQSSPQDNFSGQHEEQKDCGLFSWTKF